MCIRDRLETVTYGIRDGRSISFEDFSELGFNVPDIKEQRKIGKLSLIHISYSMTGF